MIKNSERQNRTSFFDTLFTFHYLYTRKNKNPWNATTHTKATYVSEIHYHQRWCAEIWQGVSASRPLAMGRGVPLWRWIVEDLWGTKSGAALWTLLRIRSARTGLHQTYRMEWHWWNTTTIILPSPLAQRGGADTRVCKVGPTLTPYPPSRIPSNLGLIWLQCRIEPRFPFLKVQTQERRKGIVYRLLSTYPT